VWDDELDPVAFRELLEAYTLRKEWEAELLANKILLQLAKALGGKDPSAYRRVKPGQLLQELGVKL